MKEFIKNKKVTYNLMSFTGFKSLLIFSMLSESPKSYEDVKKAFETSEILNETLSLDTLRVYINSLKRIGCKVKRIKIDGVSKYAILSNPFGLNITIEQIHHFAKLYKTLAHNITLHEIIILENLIQKISHYINDLKQKEALAKVSILKNISLELINNLYEHCESGKQLLLNYRSPNSGSKNIEIITKEIRYANGKLYLDGLNLGRNRDCSLLINRINSIKSINECSTIPDMKLINIGYELICNQKDLELTQNEQLLDYKNGKATVEATVSDPFFLTQKLLSYGPECKVLYPQEYKDYFICELNQMKAGYSID